MAFIPYNANPLYKDTDDCTVRAISLFTGKTYDETFVGISVTGFELKQVMVTNSTWARYLLRLGYVRTAIPNYCPECYTTREFCRDHPKGTYLLSTGTHVITVIDGDYYDTWDSGDTVPLGYWSERSK